MRIFVVGAGVLGLACADVPADERCSACFGEAFTHAAIVSARVFTGNRPTTSIMAPSLTPVGPGPADRPVRAHHLR
ncbi:hypothetical protein [uncultured Actinomyces sp.]|uniref:hypothetical protein n=1 Tax=uncultured Actinomyces sp. TaxID=249061 RepID=UPI0028E87734|nr:hypothetical protein [uncultured Actinomyces sp.]